MREYSRKLLKIKNGIDELLKENKLENIWNKDLYDKFKEVTKIWDFDTPHVSESKKSLRYIVDAYNKDLERFKDINESQNLSLYEKSMISLRPYLLIIIISIQLEKVTNNLLVQLYL